MIRHRLNHSFILSAYLFAGVISLQNAHAASDSEAGIAIYNQIMQGKSAPCKSISDGEKLTAINSIANACLNKTSSNGNVSYTQRSSCAGGSGSPYNTIVNALKPICDSKAAQAAANAAQGGGKTAAAGVNVAARLLQNKQVNKFLDGVDKKIGSSGAADATADAGKIDKIPQVGNFNFNTASNGAINKAIDQTDQSIAGYNKQLDSINQERGRQGLQPLDKVPDNKNDYFKAGGGKSSSAGVDQKPPEATTNTAAQEPKAEDTTTITTQNKDGSVMKQEVTADGEVIAAQKYTPEQAQAAVDSTKPAADASLPQAPAAIADQAQKTASTAAGASDLVSKSKTPTSASQAEATAFIGKIDAVLLKGQSACAAEASGTLGVSSSCAPAFTSAISSLRVAIAKYAPTRAVCSVSNVSAGVLCPLTSNPVVKQVQLLMAGVTPLLKKASSASESCSTIENTSNIAQYGMAAAGLICTGAKVACDTSCALTATTLDSMIDIAYELSLVLSATTEAASSEMLTLIANEKKNIAVNIGQCQKHAISIAETLKQGLLLAAASKSARDCKKQLTAGGSSSISGTSAGPIVTTAEFCANNANSSNITCKCTNNPNADGCLGAFSGAGVKGAVFKNGNGTSGMASMGGNSSSSPSPVDKGLTKEEKKALGLNVDESKNKDGNSDSSAMAAAGSGGGSSGANASAGGLTTDGQAKVGAEGDSKKSKFGFSFSGLSGGLSGLFGSGSNKNKNNSVNGLSQQKLEEQENAIKRKIASDQVRSEVSNASGKSNFDKVRNRYQMTTSSLFDGQ